MVISSGVVFTIVTVFLLYSVWRFRAAPGDDSDGPPIHGHTGLEILWAAIPALLLAFVTVYSWVVLDRNEAVASDRLVVQTTAQQFVWRFAYPDARIQSGELRVPVDRQVELQMRVPDRDVIHSFFVPEFRVKQDLVPGITTRVRFTPTRIGTYPVMCTELCGVGHNIMRSRVIVMSPEDYSAWLEAAARAAGT